MSHIISKYIIAGTRAEFVDYCAKNSKEGLYFIYVDYHTRLAGVKNVEGVFVGTWYLRGDIREIIQRLYVCAKDSKKINEIHKHLNEIELMDTLGQY